MTQFTPRVPESLHAYAADSYLASVEPLASRSLADFRRSMPEPQLFARFGGNTAIRATLLRPKDFDPAHAVIVPYPFGLGQHDFMHVRDLVTLQAVGGNKQLVCFPNNDYGQEFYWPNDKQLQTLAKGDASPIAASMLDAVEALGVETVDILGYSQAALAATDIMKEAQKRGSVQVEKVLLADPTNVIDRSDSRLRKDFMATGMMPLRKAVKDADIPALVEAQAMRPQDFRRLGRKFFNVLISSKLPANKAWHSGMTHDNLGNNLVTMELLNPRVWVDTELTMARAENSRITPEHSSYKGIAHGIARRNLQLEGYGHEAADNVTGVWGPLVRAAMDLPKYC